MPQLENVPQTVFFSFYCIFINKSSPGLYVLEIIPLKVAQGNIGPKSDLFRWKKFSKEKSLNSKKYHYFFSQKMEIYVKIIQTIEIVPHYA